MPAAPSSNSKKFVVAVAVVVFASVILLYAATGVVVSFSPQGATRTYAYGINVNGTIAGSWMDSASVWHGYLRDPSWTLTIIDEPDALIGTNQGTSLVGSMIWVKPLVPTLALPAPPWGAA